VPQIRLEGKATIDTEYPETARRTPSRRWRQFADVGLKSREYGSTARDQPATFGEKLRRRQLLLAERCAGRRSATRVRLGNVLHFVDDYP
jgi:hypothetical protein